MADRGANSTGDDPKSGPGGDRQGSRPASLSGEQARQGRIILNTPARRRLFIGGLIAIVVVLLVIAIVS